MANEKFKFEEKLGELEKIVLELEKGDVTLDEMLTDFEKGISIARECTKVLDSVEKRINVLTKKPDGQVVEEKFVEGSE